MLLQTHFFEDFEIHYLIVGAVYKLYVSDSNHLRLSERNATLNLQFINSYVQ